MTDMAALGLVHSLRALESRIRGREFADPKITSHILQALQDLEKTIRLAVRAADPEPSGMRRFRVYRPSPPQEHYEAGRANPPDQVQFEGVQFSDGRVAVRWLTEYRSTSLWDCYEDLDRIHGHPEYLSVVEWLD
jgi:hypothetical protein